MSYLLIFYLTLYIVFYFDVNMSIFSYVILLSVFFQEFFFHRGYKDILHFLPKGLSFTFHVKIFNLFGMYFLMLYSCSLVFFFSLEKSVVPNTVSEGLCISSLGLLWLTTMKMYSLQLSFLRLCFPLALLSFLWCPHGYMLVHLAA